MTEKIVNMCGKEVGLAYCFATEIAFKNLSDGDITDFMGEAVESIQKNRMPDVKRTIHLVLAAHTAYTEGHSIQELTIKDIDLMIEAKPEEVATALGTIINLRAQFYHVPAGEKEDKKESEGDKEKND